MTTAWREANREKILLWRRKTREKKRVQIRALLAGLKNVPCADCKGQFDPCVMDFDHLDPSQKKHNIHTMSRRSDLKGLMAEIAKCEVVCANCHRLRTKRRWEANLQTTTVKEASKCLTHKW